MPDVKLLPSPRVNPYAYDNSKAVTSIMQILGQGEVARRREFMTRNVLEALSRGKGTQGISSAALMEPGFSSGIPGLLQRIASPFAAQTPGIDDIIAGRGIESAFQTISPSQMMAGERWNKYQEAVAKGDTDTAKRLLSSALVNFNVPTSREIWDQPERDLVAEVELKKKLELSSAERTTAKKGVEDVFESTPIGAGRTLGWHYGIKDYEKPTVIDMYKQWLTEQGYETRPPRQKKTLDGIWDGKMALMNKMGFKFKDKERGTLTKNEIWWDPNDPEVKKLRGAIGQEMPSSRTAPTGGDVIGTLEGTPAQRKAIDAIVGKRLAPEQKQTLINKILNNERIRVKDNAGRIGDIPAEQLADWLAISGNTLAVEDRRK